MKSLRYCQHTFIPSFIKNGDVVLDCGANHGEFSAWMAEHMGVTVHGFEADPKLFALLPELPGVHFYGNAVAAAEGVLKFNLGADTASSLHFTGTAYDIVEVQAVRLEDFCSREGIRHVALLKLDIEGEEVPVLETASDRFLQSISQITVEFHDAIRPDDLPAIQRILKRMQGLGFYIVKVSYSDYADVLLVNRQFCRLSAWDRVSLVLFGKFKRGLMRAINRKTGRLGQFED